MFFLYVQQTSSFDYPPVNTNIQTPAILYKSFVFLVADKKRLYDSAQLKPEKHNNSYSVLMYLSFSILEVML